MIENKVYFRWARFSYSRSEFSSFLESWRGQRDIANEDKGKEIYIGSRRYNMGARKERRARAIEVDRGIFWLVYECPLWKDLHSTSITIGASCINVKRRMYTQWCFVFCIYHGILQYWPPSLSPFLFLLYYPCANPVVSLVLRDEAFALGGARKLGIRFNLGPNLPVTLIKYIWKLLHLFCPSSSRVTLGLSYFILRG